MNTERSRKEFEVWATANGISIVRTNQALMFANGQRRAIGDYIMVESVCARAAWQASRSALVIELPQADTNMITMATSVDKKLSKLSSRSA